MESTTSRRYRALGVNTLARLPTQAEIAARCAKIREGWSEAERVSRLRCDWRPVLSVLHEMSLKGAGGCQ
jgi:hypothetical protein